MLLFAALNSHAQVFWTETFSNGCTSACLANSYSGPNGAWTVTSTGANTASSNKWFVSGAECGNAAGQCGTACGAADASLHIGSDIIIAIDPGAAYYAGIASNWRAESPIINCTGKSNITVSFNYITEGQPGADFAGIAYYDGTTWYYYNGSAWTTTFTALPVTNNASCAPQGLWTAYSVMLPASANNNPSVKIGFRWVNDNDGAGTDPSIAIDDINVSSSAPSCSVSINPIFPAILCHGDCNSALGATATGLGPIQYSWNTIPVQTTSAAVNLCAGTYTVTITDSTGCTATASMTITQPTQLIASVFGSNFHGWGEPCNGDCLDTLTVAATGGTPPYAFIWSNGCFTQSCPNLCAGTYTVAVTDANGCTATASYTITEPPVLTMGAPIITNPSCTGCSDGSICLGPHSGGTPAYTYSLTPNAGNFNGNCWQNLPAGIYTVCITDANGCTVCLTDTLVDPPSGIVDNFSSGAIILSPNIISTSALLTVPFTEMEFTFTAYDCFGKKVREKIFSERQMAIEKGNLSAGLYFFELTGNQRRFYGGKFIIE